MRTTLLRCFALLLALPPMANARASNPLHDQLTALYPDLTAQELQAKLDSTSDGFHFLRTFVPYYYSRVAQSPAGLVPLQTALGSHGGWCVGDAHLENFGAVLNRLGHANFTLNDLDDAGPCPLYADTLRFLTGVLLNSAGTNLTPLLAAYRSGLKGDSLPLSPESQALLNASESGGTTLPPHKLDGSAHLKRSAGDTETNTQERQALQSALNGASGAGRQLLDSFKTRKAGGGSGGLLRFETLFSQAGGGIQGFEFKQMVQPGCFPLATAPIPALQDRVAQSISIELGPDSSPEYRTVVLGTPPLGFLIRPLWAGNLGVKLSDYPSSRIEGIAEDEMHSLGSLHRKSMDPDYLTAVLDTPDSSWTAAATELANIMNQAFHELSLEAVQP